jgi:hypothetical protein
MDEHRDGELVELGSGQTSRCAPRVSDMAAFHGELKWLARERGYAPGWIAHKFRERSGACRTTRESNSQPLARQA